MLELGCGLAGIVALTMAPKVGRYIATDQEYVFKCLRQNLEQNAVSQKSTGKMKRRHRKGAVDASTVSGINIELLALDWESSSLDALPWILGATAASGELDVVVACDCIYNEALVEPFVRTCVQLCRLSGIASPHKPTLCMIAQQLRSYTVFEAWLAAFNKAFRVWRMPDKLLTDGLKAGSGFVIHLGILRDAID